MRKTEKIRDKIDTLADMSATELREAYRAAFGEDSRSNHREYLQKRIAWKLQANVEGGISQKAYKRAEEIADDSDLRVRLPKASSVIPKKRTIRQRRPMKDNRLPMPGTVLSRPLDGKMIKVTVLDSGFEYKGKIFKSLSAVAKHITNKNWNGYAFFGLTGGANG